MHGYLATFRAHRRLLLVAVVIAAAIGGWFSFGAAKTYRSTALVWVDNGPAVGSSLSTALATATSDDPPASVVQSELTQLLTSVTFDRGVGGKSLLHAYYASGAKARGFNLSVLLSRGVSDPSYAVVHSLATKVTATVVGPQLLSVSYVGPTPKVSQSVLRTLIARMSHKSKQFGADYLAAEERYYAKELTKKEKSVTSLEQAVVAYQRQNPGATAASDPIYEGLLSAAENRKSTLDARTAVIEKVVSQAANGAVPLLQVVDHPTMPSTATKGVGAGLLGVLAGAFAGIVVVILTILVLTPEPEVRWDRRDPPRRRGRGVVRHLTKNGLA